MIADLDNLVRSAARESTAAWMEGFGKIATKAGDIVRPKCNEFQRRVSDIIDFCRREKRPCRIIILKPRQKGSSTVSVAATYRRLQRRRGRGLIAGGAHFQGANLFKILETYAGNDDLDPKSCKVMDMEARFRNGSELQRITLANGNAGRSGTYQVVVVTEVAYLAEEGVANASEVLNGLLKCVGYFDDTIIILESTAKGASGDYYDRYQEAITFEEFQAGKNGYIKVFYPWFAFEDSRIEDAVSEGIRGWEDVSQHEQELAEKWGLDLHQIAWMRWALREECGGDWDRFCQDYPFDEETAFLKSGRNRFNAEGIKYQEGVAKRTIRQFGVMEHDQRADRVSFRPTSEQEARMVVFEKPRVGCRYLVSVDSMTGASQTGGDDPDSHGIFVLRQGYIQAGSGRWIEPAVCARNILYADGPRFGCWWDIDVVEEEVYRLARYYGGCIIVPEMNMDRGLVELLKLRPAAHIYQREMFNRREGVKTKALGWMTDPKTRPMIIETLARAIRESGKGQPGEGLEIRCPWAIKQLKNFVVKPNGRSEAAQGHHDDDVLSLSIGLQCIDHATPYVEQVREQWIPPDLRGLEERRAVGRKQYL